VKDVHGHGIKNRQLFLRIRLEGNSAITVLFREDSCETSLYLPNSACIRDTIASFPTQIP
jgi:hypothetical protein